MFEQIGFRYAMQFRQASTRQHIAVGQRRQHQRAMEGGLHAIA